MLLAFAWVANPFTLYALNMNTNDALVGALLAWFIAALSVPWLRGALLAAAGLAKLGPLALVPLLMSLRRRRGDAGRVRRLASLLLLSMLARQSDGLHLFWERTFHYQLNRVTPLSIWTLGALSPGVADPALAAAGAAGGGGAGLPAAWRCCRADARTRWPWRRWPRPR